MGKAYTQVTMEERCEIACLRSQGSSLRQIAAGVDRPPSTVARELKRNGSRTLGYQPRYANQQAHARRWRGSRLERDGPLRERFSPVWARAGLRRRWPGVSRWTRGDGSSPMRASTGSSTPRWPGRRTTPGGTTCPGPRPSAAFGAGAAAALPLTSPTGSLLSWLPDNTTECDVRRWSGSSPEERESAQGLEGLFHSTDEVDDFVARLSAALAGRSQPDEGEPA